MFNKKKFVGASFSSFSNIPIFDYNLPILYYSNLVFPIKSSYDSTHDGCDEDT
uniref:Uncharacterized protein n=1 Tax=Rhizophagus irregularis (strain DAOM 181602 / DAOM 197198 / MUCL 43194) TaxID=747089 RepID=U9TC26_RHIID